MSTKNFALVLVATLLSSGAFAAQKTISVEGKKADAIMTALENAGSFTDCGAGTCGTEASDIQCLTHSQSQVTQCDLTVQTEEGTQKKIEIAGKKASALSNAISDAGVAGDCGMGTCGFEVKSIQALMLGNAVNDRSYSATISYDDGLEATSK